ncbi:MAG: Fic family protein [Ilumatobacteraceae bacterium]
MDQNADPTVPVTPGHVTVYWRGGRPYSRVAAAMDDLVAFANRRDIAPLVHVAVAHAQFETIRPFPDGNGRTGRALVHAMLRHRGITRAVTVPISAASSSTPAPTSARSATTALDTSNRSSDR